MFGGSIASHGGSYGGLWRGHGQSPPVNYLLTGRLPLLVRVLPLYSIIFSVIAQLYAGTPHTFGSPMVVMVLRLLIDWLNHHSPFTPDHQRLLSKLLLMLYFLEDLKTKSKNHFSDSRIEIKTPHLQSLH